MSYPTPQPCHLNGKPAYLVTQAAALYDETSKQLLRGVPDIKRIPYFKFSYRLDGKVCFVCEDPVIDCTLQDAYDEVACLKCGEKAHLSRKAM